MIDSLLTEFNTVRSMRRTFPTSMSGHLQERFGELSIVEWYRVPLRERVADRLADLMFNADDLLVMLKAEDVRKDFALARTNHPRGIRERECAHEVDNRLNERETNL